MYVKLFNRILDSSIADNRKLRHFFTDLLLCSDSDGNVIMTKSAIANRIRASIEEVEWGMEELMKPEEGSLTPEHDGRRLVPLEGHGYGWKIVNFEAYRDLRSAEEMRRQTKERVARWREKQKEKSNAPKKIRRGKPLTGEAIVEAARRRGASEAECDRMQERIDREEDELRAEENNGDAV